MARVRITVVKKLNTKDLFGNHPPAAINKEMLTPECHRFQVGQEFFVDTTKDISDPQSWENCPTGFCTWAYADIQRDISHILFGGSYPWIKEKGVIITCCTDGLRPVIFRVERIED
jgi:uncharacterized repeat protein (TIGR04076 family)